MKDFNKVKKKLLLLGGSAQQVIAIKKAKELGCRTILCDYLPDNPGQYIADKYYNVSTTDVEAVYEIAIQEKVDGILAYASDPAALPSAIICERLELPTNPVRAVEILGQKHLFRKFLKENNFACPHFCIFNSYDNIDTIKLSINDFSFPIIIKPTDSCGSKGVTLLEKLDELENAIKNADSYSRNKILIAEEFIQRSFPRVVGGDIFVIDGEIVLYGIMSCLRGQNGNSFIPIGERKPSGLNEIQTQNVQNELDRIIKLLGIKFGELNIEILIDEKNNVYFLELGPRAGGNMIPIQLSDIYKIDLVEANILGAIGEKIELKINEQEGFYLTYVVHSSKNGIFKGIYYSPKIEKYIYRKEIYKREGDLIEKLENARNAVGILFMKFDTEDEMNNILQDIDNQVVVEEGKSRGIFLLVAAPEYINERMAA